MSRGLIGIAIAVGISLAAIFVYLVAKGWLE